MALCQYFVKIVSLFQHSISALLHQNEWIIMHFFRHSWKPENKLFMLIFIFKIGFGANSLKKKKRFVFLWLQNNPKINLNREKYDYFQSQCEQFSDFTEPLSVVHSLLRIFHPQGIRMNEYKPLNASRFNAHRYIKLAYAAPKHDERQWQ